MAPFLQYRVTIMRLRVFRMAMFFLVVFSILTSESFRAWAGGSCTSCGGSGDREHLEDVVDETFNALTEIEKLHPLTLFDGSVVSAELLRDRLREAYAPPREIHLIYSKNDADCPLRDDTKTCVDFLSVPSQKQLSIDMGRLNRHHQKGSKYDREYIRRQLIHEAFRMADVDDRNYQYSKDLDLLVDQYVHNSKNIDWFLDRPLPCAPRSGGISRTERLALEAQEAARRVNPGPIGVGDLIGKRFVIPHYNGVFFEFRQEGPFLFASEFFQDGKPYGGYNDLFCGRANSVDLNKQFRCSNSSNETYGDLYVDVEIKKSDGAPLYLDLFLGPHIGARPGWIEQSKE